MRLHHLEVSAFGPFSGTETVDFDALSDAGLFLIQGRTGAGKTSILDAVCFALYGQVPGARRAVKGLRSDHAAPGDVPRVVLETTIRGRRLRITRTPEWERPKLRGSGTKKEQHKVVLEEFANGSWTGLSIRIDETADLVQRLLGMDATQFCQVALLPQGEFAGFLRAKADDRRKVLEKLFATEVFAQVEKWLAERRAAAGRDADGLASDAMAIAGQIAERAGGRPPEDVDALPAWAAELTGVHDDVLAVTEALSAEAVTAEDAARAALESARGVAERRQRYAHALQRRDALAGRAEEHSRVASRLDAAARADRVVPLLREVRQRHATERQARAWAAETRSRVAELLPPGASEDVLVKAERDRRDEIAALDGRRADAARLSGLDDEVTALARELARLEPEEARLAAALADLPGVAERQRAELEEARVAAAGRAGAAAAVADVRRRLDAARRRDQVEDLLAAAEDAHRAAVDAAQDTRQRVLDLRQDRLNGMAAVLAEELRDGEPCRVCGSPEHPAPGTSHVPIPTEDDVEAAQAAADAAQHVRERSGQKAEGLRAERDGLLEAAGELTVEALSDELAEAGENLRALEARAAEADRLEGVVHRAEQELDRVRDTHQVVAQALTANRARQDELDSERTRLRAALDEARGTDPTLEARVDRLGGEAAGLAEAAEALREAGRAGAELAAARARAKAAAVDAGFRGPDEVVAAELPDEDQAALRDRIRRHEDEEALVRDLLRDPELRAAAAAPAPGLPALEAAVAAAEAARTGAASAADRARHRRARLAEHRVRLDTAVRAWRPAAEAHAVAARLAGLASGRHPENRHAMSLPAYVLAARLMQVVAAANERLTRMSGGRYELVHTTDKSAGDRTRGAGGLGLRVVDAWTGQERDPVTLSGGESFITSLSLALGLADVVTAEAGGAEIGTLFVDEGFGTLDEETLDEVMDVLDALRDGGRAVGIVSHVAELRARVPAQLRVRKNRDGSTITIAT
ncbi:AAA family ATPase [Spirillospora albida]|uniref:AAA family ATPase n=1 Tax=Spirillospora albida TaxID=58123 RepID=UPI0004C261AD|nr:SMC family ATPase [Spirillospora albida]